MSSTVISTLIKDLQKLVIEGNTNPHNLLAKELSQLNSTNFIQENKDLKTDILTYLAELKQLIQSLSKIPLGNYSQFEATILDKNSYFTEVIKPKLDSLYNKVKAPTGDFSNRIVDTIIVQVRNSITTISSKLSIIKSEVNKLQVAEANKQRSTTPTAVANSSVKDVDNLVQQWLNNKPPRTLDTVLLNKTDFVNEFNQIDEFDLKVSFEQSKRDIKLISYVIQAYSKLLTLVTFKTDKDYITKQKGILTRILSIVNSSNKDTKANDSKVPTLPTTDNTSKSTPTTTTEETKTEVPLTPEQWGIKFTVVNTPAPSFNGSSFPTKAFYMDLLPARQSTIPVQGGRDVPNAMPGLNYKLIPAVSKQQIPGFSPVYQNLGIKGMQVTIVGTFTGYDGSSDRGTDTPDPKSRFWSNAKGSPTLADNPGRGNILSEATAYNSYTEFVQLCHQGKHMEVEINLFQVYQTSTATEIGEKVKLQSKTGNPKFTGVVRSLDVYHQTKDRTWYTLVMDVTDFGMASKEPINLNNKLQEAIEAARQQLEQAQTEAAKREAEENAATIPGDPEITNTILNIKQRILDLKDNTQRTKQLAIYDHLLEHIKVLKSKDNYALKKYNGGQPWTTFLTNLGSYSDSSFFPISNSQILFRIRLDCRVLLGIQGTCNSELYWLLDGTEENIKPITKFIGNGTRQSTFLMLPNEKRQRISNDPFGFGPHPEEDGSESQRNSLLSQAKNLTNAERGALTIKAIGCVAIGALGTGLATVGTAGGALVPGIAATLGSCAVFTSAEAYEKYDTLNKNEAQWSNAVWGELAMDLLLTLGTVGVVRGGGALLSKVTKQGSIITNPITGSLDDIDINLPSGFFTPAPQTIVNQVDDIAIRLKSLNTSQVAGKVVTSNGVEYTIDDLVKNASDDVVAFKVRSPNGTSTQLNLNQIDSYDRTLFSPQPTVTTNVPNNTQQPQVTPPVNQTPRLTTEIDRLRIPDSTKTLLKTLDPSQQRRVLTVINTQKANPNKAFFISRQGQPDLVVNPGDDFRINTPGFTIRKGSTVIDIPYEEVTGSRVILSSTIPPSPQTPTQPPQSSVPQQQTTTTTQNPVNQQPIQSTQPVVNQPPVQVTWIDDFNSNPNKYKPSAIIKESPTSLNNRINNPNSSITFESNSQGNFWVLNTALDEFSVVPKAGFNYSANKKSTQAYFEIIGKPNGTNYEVISPAFVRKVGNNYQLIQKGVLGVR